MSPLAKVRPEKKPSVRGARTRIIPDPFQELVDLADTARGVSATDAARLENLLANKQEEYEIEAAAHPQNGEKQKLAEAALTALLKVRNWRLRTRTE